MNRLSHFALSLSCCAAFAAQAAGKPDVFELTIWKFKADLNFEQAKLLATELNASYKKLAGFEKRHLYFDKTKGVWINQIKWKNIEAAKKGRDDLAKDPQMQKLEEKTDKASVQRFESEKLLELGD